MSRAMCDDQHIAIEHSVNSRRAIGHPAGSPSTTAFARIIRRGPRYVRRSSSGTNGLADRASDGRDGSRLDSRALRCVVTRRRRAAVHHGHGPRVSQRDARHLTSWEQRRCPNSPAPACQRFSSRCQPQLTITSDSTPASSPTTPPPSWSNLALPSPTPCEPGSTNS